MLMRRWRRSARRGPGTGVEHRRGFDQNGPVVIDLDATLVTAHSDMQDTTRTWKWGFGSHPVRREALTIRAEVKDHRHRPAAAGRLKLRAA
jgi:hypothetical protein